MKKLGLILATAGIIAATSAAGFAAADVSLSKDGARYTPIRYSFTNYGKSKESAFCSRIGYTPMGGTTKINNTEVTLADNCSQLNITVYDINDHGRGVRLRWDSDGKIEIVGHEFDITRDDDGAKTTDTGLPVNIGAYLTGNNRVFIAVPDPTSGGGRVFVTDEIAEQIERFLYPTADDEDYGEAYDAERLEFLHEMRNAIYSIVD